MAENDEYYKEIKEKQQELLITLISPKKKHDYSSEIANLQKRFASFSLVVASIRVELGSIKRQLSKIETELINIKNEITLNNLTVFVFVRFRKYDIKIAKFFSH